MRLPIGIAISMVLATAITAHAQASPFCAKPGDTLKVFDTERREPFSGVVTTIPPNPALFPLLGGLLDGTLEVRERLVYFRHEKAIRLITFVIPSALPFPTHEGDFLGPATTIVERATLNVDKIYLSCKPLPSIMWVGTMRQDFPRPGDSVYPGGWGVNVTGATFAFSTGYTTNDNRHPPGSVPDLTFVPPSAHRFYDCSDGLFNVTESVAGVGVAWAPCAVGDLSFEKDKKDKDDKDKDDKDKDDKDKDDKDKDHH
jgi:hypothetical protein